MENLLIFPHSALLPVPTPCSFVDPKMPVKPSSTLGLDLTPTRSRELQARAASSSALVVADGPEVSRFERWFWVIAFSCIAGTCGLWSNGVSVAFVIRMNSRVGEQNKNSNHPLKGLCMHDQTESQDLFFSVHRIY